MIARRVSPFATARTIFSQGVALMGIYWIEDRSSLLFAAFDTLIVPALMMYLGVCLLRGDGASLVHWLAGCLAFGTGLSTMTSCGALVLHDQLRGRVTLLRSAGVGPGSYLLAHLGAALALSMVSVCGGIAGLCAIGVISPSASMIVFLLGASLIGGTAMGAIGAAIGATAPHIRSGQARLSMGSIGLTLIGPNFYHIERLPEALRIVAQFSPFYALARVDQALMSSGTTPWLSIVLLVMLALAANALALKAMRWR